MDDPGLQLDWKRVSGVSADNANCNFGINYSLNKNTRSLSFKIELSIEF